MTTRSQRPFLIMAGGTGGHVYPALAVARRLIESGMKVLWLGTRQGLEARVVPDNGIPLLYISIAGLRGKGWRSWVLAPVRLLLAVLQALFIVLRYRPCGALGMGGFASGPGGIAVWLANLPLLVHEQNAVAGTTNRLLARVATRVMEAFPQTFPAYRHALHTGNPLRAEFSGLPDPQTRLAGRGGDLRLLVLGGSQGARHLNHTLPLALGLLQQRSERAVPVQVRHQSGSRHYDDTAAAYADAAVTVQLDPFIDDMVEAYSWADLVVCRSGALTVSELAAVGVASVLVPFPYAIDDHQTRNAAPLVDAGAAVLLPEVRLDARSLAKTLSGFVDARDRLLAMATAARRLSLPNATELVAAECREVAGV